MKRRHFALIASMVMVALGLLAAPMARVALAQEDDASLVEEVGSLADLDEGGLLVVQEDGPTIYRMSGNPDPSLAELRAYVNERLVSDFDPTRKDYIVIIEDSTPCAEEPHLKFTWGGVDGTQFDIYSLVSGPYEQNGGARRVDAQGNVIVDYARYYQYAFTRKNAANDDPILGMYAFKHVYHLIVGPDTHQGGSGGDGDVETPTNPPSVADAVVTLGRTSYAYDGSAKDPGVASVTFHGQELAEGVDYRVERPAGRTNAGTYSYVVRGVNNFVGTSSASFRIERAANGMSVRRSTRKIEAAKVAKKKRVVRPLGVTGASGRVTYRRLSKGSSKRLSVNRRTGRVTVRKGTKPGTYRVRIRVAAAGDANHRAAAKTVTCKVRVR